MENSYSKQYLFIDFRASLFSNVVAPTLQRNQTWTSNQQLWICRWGAVNERLLFIRTGNFFRFPFHARQSGIWIYFYWSWPNSDTVVSVLSFVHDICHSAWLIVQSRRHHSVCRFLGNFRFWSDCQKKDSVLRCADSNGVKSWANDVWKEKDENLNKSVFVKYMVVLQSTNFTI